jgi:uncharacterized membrane protein
MQKVAEPLSKLVPIDSVADIAFVNIVAIGLIVLVCFLAGLVAKTERAKRMVSSLESRVLTNIPIYDVIKAKIQGTIQASQEAGMTPVLTRFDDQWQIAMEVERLADGRVAVFLPGSPDPWSGAVSIVSGDRVEPLDTALPSVVKSLKALGKGSDDVVRGKQESRQSPG